MNVSIRQDLADFVKEKVEVGRYRDISDAVNDALRLLKERDEAEFSRLRSTLQERLQEADQGGSIPFDDKVLQRIRRS